MDMDQDQPPSDSQELPEPSTPPASGEHSAAALKDSTCLNCGTTLQGDWCHACGQPVKNMVRELDAVIVDVVDTLLIYDKRIWSTLVPLYLRPGFITNRFVAGQQARYVPPFRLFFVLSLVTFLALQFLVVPAEMFNFGAQVEQEDPTSSTPVEPPAVDSAGPAEPAVPDRGDSPDGTPSRFDLADLENGEWQVQFDWLPAAANGQLNAWLQLALGNVERAGEDPGRLVDSMFNLLPVALFVLMPVFALLLKILYIFRRRLYMEHLVVALHSHAFLFMAILVCMALGLFANAVTDIPVLGVIGSVLFELSQLWIPLYLLLMQKSVYRQGWTMTIGKYLLLGLVYLSLILFVVLAAVVISLVTF